MMPYNHTKFQVKTHQGAGSVGKKSPKNPENPEKLSPGRGGWGYWGGRPLWDNSAYLHPHRRDIAQTFMVDSPNDAPQTRNVSGQDSQTGRVGGQKSLKNPENPEQLSPTRGGGVLGWATTLGQCSISPSTSMGHHPNCYGR